MGDSISMNIPEYIDGLPNICGSENLIKGNRKTVSIYLPESNINFQGIKSAFAVVLHMHQPLIPARGKDQRAPFLISNLKYMMDNQHIGDNHNAPVFHSCYKRMGEFIPSLVHEGKQPRIALDYSGCLLHGLRQMGLHDVFDNLKRITCDPLYRRHVEWLGTAWGHAVAPGTPVQDFRLQVQAWRHHFAAIFGLEALERVKGFSPPEMAIPNHPDVAYEFVKTLKDCDYKWVLIQEHSIELENGSPINHPHIPHLLVCKNSLGESVSIIAIIKTQGSDTKLVGQMQPYYEAKGLSHWTLGNRSVPPLVTQIADGENGGVMMNEFPPKFFQVTHEASYSETPAVNPTEYLEYLETTGITEAHFPIIQPIFQRRIWERFRPGDGLERLTRVIEELKQKDHRFHMEGGSWTNNISWLKNYEAILGPMEKISALFAEKVLAKNIPANEYRYRNALFHLLTMWTSCYRYWGQGIWTEYAQEICRHLSELLNSDF